MLAEMIKWEIWFVGDTKAYKEDFLCEINIKAKVKKVELLYEDDKFKIFGLSFYNYQIRHKFEKKFKEVLKVE